MPQQVANRGPSAQRPRASTETTQNASGSHWSDEDHFKSKHMRNASEMTSITITIDTGKAVSSDYTATPLPRDRELAIAQKMQPNVDTGRRPDNPADIKTPVAALRLEQLIDRLLERPMREADYMFHHTFWSLYRKFASPSECLGYICQKFEDAGRDANVPHLQRLSYQLRVLTALCLWLSTYPGDFAHPTTNLKAVNFARSIAQSPDFSYGSREMLSLLENIKVDEETYWGICDGRERSSTEASIASIPPLRMALPLPTTHVMMSPSEESVASSFTSGDDLLRDNLSSLSLNKPGSRRSETSSITSSMMEREGSTAGSISASIATTATATGESQYEAARKQANMLLQPTNQSLTKAHWQEFMAIDNDVIAHEITRIDWVMFSIVRPRDLVRHINLSGAERASCRGLEHIDRMIDHFNHMSSWIVEMILLRKKAKDRAQMMEKCMAIGWKLRQMNNYNGVGAFVAGISNVSIKRLHQTTLLVDKAILKNFMRCEILMGMTKGYFAYRLAWTNTSKTKIPFLPLHRHDLVLAEEASPTWADKGKTTVNWTKFEIMGKCLWDIQRGQSTPFQGLHKNRDVQRLLMQGRVSKDLDDVFYDLSVSLEPSANSDSSRRKSGWLK